MIKFEFWLNLFNTHCLELGALVVLEPEHSRAGAAHMEKEDMQVASKILVSNDFFFKS